MDNEYRMLLKRAGWLLDHGYMQGDIHIIAENLRLAEQRKQANKRDK